MGATMVESGPGQARAKARARRGGMARVNAGSGKTRRTATDHREDLERLKDSRKPEAHQRQLGRKTITRKDHSGRPKRIVKGQGRPSRTTTDQQRPKRTTTD